MFKPITMILFFSVLSWGFPNLGAIAQITSNIEEDNITLSGESLEGIDIQTIDDIEYEQNRTRLDLTLETEKESYPGDLLFEGLLEEAENNESPFYTIKRINTNKGDGTDSHQGTIPLTSF